jgi:hypothetical protein
VLAGLLLGQALQVAEPQGFHLILEKRDVLQFREGDAGGLKGLAAEPPLAVAYFLWSWHRSFLEGKGCRDKIPGVVRRTERLLNSGFTVQEKKGEINPFV